MYSRGDEVYISSGSACSKGKQSGCAKALGLPKARTDSALRVSFATVQHKGKMWMLLWQRSKGRENVPADKLIRN